MFSTNDMVGDLILSIGNRLHCEKWTSMYVIYKIQSRGVEI